MSLSNAARKLECISYIPWPQTKLEKILKGCDDDYAKCIKCGNYSHKDELFKIKIFGNEKPFSYSQICNFCREHNLRLLPTWSFEKEQDITNSFNFNQSVAETLVENIQT